MAEDSGGDGATRGSRAALAGVVFAVLFALGWILLRSSPGINASDAELVEYFDSAERRRMSQIAALYVLPLAAIAFMWFTAALRDRVVRGSVREHPMYAAVHLIASTVFTTAIFVMAAIELALVWSIDAEAIDVGGARVLVSLETAVSQLIALRASAVFVMVSTTRAMRSGLFPNWFGYVSFAMAAALMLVATTWRPVLLTLPVWVVLASWWVMIDRPNRTRSIHA